MTHLSREELIRWRDEGAASDRDAVIAHLAACESCRRELSALVQLEAAREDTTLDPQQFVARGIEAYTAPRRAWWQRPAAWAAAGAAAGALFAIALLQPARPVEPSLDVRSSELVAVAPTGEVDRVTTFRWSSPYAVNRYEVIVRDANGATVLQREAPREQLDLAGDRGATFPPGSYTWTVRALDSSGREIATSPVQPFRVR